MAKSTNVMYDALKAQFEAKKQEALANLTVYLSNPVAIGEHPDIIKEMVKLTVKLADAEGCLETLKTTFEVKANETTEE
jgi:methylaspartate ammonia-lyase